MISLAAIMGRNLNQNVGERAISNLKKAALGVGLYWIGATLTAASVRYLNIRRRLARRSGGTKTNRAMSVQKNGKNTTVITVRVEAMLVATAGELVGDLAIAAKIIVKVLRDIATWNVGIIA